MYLSSMICCYCSSVETSTIDLLDVISVELHGYVTSLSVAIKGKRSFRELLQSVLTSSTICAFDCHMTQYSAWGSHKAHGESTE